jgi:hypothetical protein
MAEWSVQHEYQLWCYINDIGERKFPLDMLGWRMQGMYGDIEKANQVGKELVDDKMIVDYEIVKVDVMARVETAQSS